MGKRRYCTKCLCVAGVVGVVGVLSLASMVRADMPANRIDFTQTADGKLIADGQVFDTWNEYVNSDLFQLRGLRCATQPSGIQVDGLRAGPSDCTYTWTNPASAYDPSVVKYIIPVVVHVIRNNSGSQGDISASMVQSQIDILNEDFLAILGSNGGSGTDIQIEFYLATTDPSGSPTTGITYSNNTTWYDDNGTYWNSLAWDTNRYLNIYTNSAGGYLGYVPDLPQGGIAGSNSDRIVILWSSFGRNGPIGSPYDQGRTTTHEVGHYLGLEHTFSYNCPSTSGCYGNGDLICDTNPQEYPTNGCSGSSCGSPDPIHNYMDYSDDLCMSEFTPEQARRIRCSLEHYRPNLYATGGGCSSDAECDDGTFCNGAETCDTGTGNCLAGSDPCPGQFCDEGGSACVDCFTNSDCDDGTFCNGAEACFGGACIPGSDPCPGQFCDESGSACVDCFTDGDCDDGTFCNGTETCVGGVCVAGSDPCLGQSCDELSQTCSILCTDTDVNCDGATDAGDILVIRGGANWNLPTSGAGDARADVDGSGTIDAGDILVIRGGAVWNTTTGPCACP